MHLFVLVESLPDGHKQFKEWLEGQQFSTGGHPIAREVKLYDITVVKTDAQKFVDQIVPLEEHRVTSPWKIPVFGRLLKKIFPIQDVEDMRNVSKEKIANAKHISEVTSYVAPGNGHGPGHKHWVHAYIIGKMDDDFDETGVEML